MPCTCSICLKLSQGAYNYTHKVENCPCGVCYAARAALKAQGNQSLVKSLVGALRRAMSAKN
jgi:hypothetical protein